MMGHSNQILIIVVDQALFNSSPEKSNIRESRNERDENDDEDDSEEHMVHRLVTVSLAGTC